MHVRLPSETQQFAKENEPFPKEFNGSGPRKSCLDKAFWSCVPSKSASSANGGVDVHQSRRPDVPSALRTFPAFFHSSKALQNDLRVIAEDQQVVPAVAGFSRRSAPAAASNGAKCWPECPPRVLPVIHHSYSRFRPGPGCEPFRESLLALAAATRITPRIASGSCSSSLLRTRTSLTLPDPKTRSAFRGRCCRDHDWRMLRIAIGYFSS